MSSLQSLWDRIRRSSRPSVANAKTKSVCAPPLSMSDNKREKSVIILKYKFLYQIVSSNFYVLRTLYFLSALIYCKAQWHFQYLHLNWVDSIYLPANNLCNFITQTTVDYSTKMYLLKMDDA